MVHDDYVEWLRSKVGHETVILNAAVAVIVNTDGYVLFIRRGDFTSEQLWALPGGMMEINESAEEAVRREIKEETGLEITTADFLGAYTDNNVVSYPNGDKCKVILFVFICKASGILKADGDESLEVKYFDPKNPPKLFREYHKTVLDDFIYGKYGIIR